MEVAVSANTKNVGAVVSTQIYRTFAIFGQYLLPGLFLIGAAVSALGRRKRNALHISVATAGVQSALEKMSWQEFEMLVGEFFRRRDFSVEETGGGGADGGVDLVVSRGADRYLVQCKQWKARQVGVETIRELYGVMAARRVAGGYVVTSGIFTDDALRFAEGREIKLIAGDQLVEMIRTAQTGAPKKDS
jgi:restriction system protein